PQRSLSPSLLSANNRNFKLTCASISKITSMPGVKGPLPPGLGLRLGFLKPSFAPQKAISAVSLAVTRPLRIVQRKSVNATRLINNSRLTNRVPPYKEQTAARRSVEE